MGIYRDTLALVLAMSSQVELLLKTAIKRIVRGKGGVLVFCCTEDILAPSCKTPTIIDEPVMIF